MGWLDSLVSYWKLDEASGNALDAHGSNTLTDNNTVGAGTGKISGARDFEAGNAEYLSHADNTDLSTGDIDFTIALWFNAETLTNYPPLVNKISSGLGDEEYKILYFTDFNRAAFDVGGGAANVQANNAGALSTGTWYHLVAWHDSVNNQIGIAINAGTPDTASWSGGVTDGAGDFYIGSSRFQNELWDGLIDEVGFWKRVLTSQERTDLYNGGAGLAYPFSAPVQTLGYLRPNRLRPRIFGPGLAR